MGFIPSGSGDDVASGLDLSGKDIHKALSYIAKAQTIKIDVVKVLLDHESEAEMYNNFQTRDDY